MESSYLFPKHCFHSIARKHCFKFAAVGGIAALAIYYWPIIRGIRIRARVCTEEAEQAQPASITKTTLLMDNRWFQLGYKVTGGKAYIVLCSTPISIDQ